MLQNHYIDTSLKGCTNYLCNKGNKMGYGIPRDRKIDDGIEIECDDCENLASWKMIGEVDSFGHETIHLCDHHYKAYTSETNTYGPCDICGSDETTYRTRDPSEGSHGPVYVRCQKHPVEFD